MVTRDSKSQQKSSKSNLNATSPKKSSTSNTKHKSKPSVVNYKQNNWALKGARSEAQYSVHLGVSEQKRSADSSSPISPKSRILPKALTHVASEPDIIVGTTFQVESDFSRREEGPLRSIDGLQSFASPSKDSREHRKTRFSANTTLGGSVDRPSNWSSVAAKPNHRLSLDPRLEEERSRKSSVVSFDQSPASALNYQQQNSSATMCQMGNINRKRSAKFLKSIGHETVADVIHHTAEQNAVDILLHAIDLECVSVLKELLEVPTFLKCVNETSKSGTYPPDMTPLMLAAHRNNIDIIQLLFKHDASEIQRLNVEINDAVSAHSNLNAYKALASPMYLISVHPTNPIHEALSLSYELHQWSLWEYEFHHEYQTMAQNVEQFALDLLDLTHPEELETLLVKGPSGQELETVTHAVELERKNFVASANFQVVLSPKWYGKSGPYLNKLRRMNVLFWYLIFLPTAVVLTLIELPLSTLIYTFYPGLTIFGVRIGDLIRIPFIKFINHMASQMTFLFLLMQAASTSANRGFNRHTGSGKNHDQNYDLLNPSLTEWWICIWVMGMVWNELKQVHTAGLSAYFGDLWNRIDATMIVLYFSTLAFRAASYLTHRLGGVIETSSNFTGNSSNYSQISSSANLDENFEISSEQEPELVWQYWDLLFLSEGVFALANIFSFMRLVTLATLSQHIGPMQISLSRMVKDVMKFMFIFFLVLLSFACGLHQLNWFFKTDCKHSDPTVDYTSGVGGVCMDGSDKKAFDSLLMAMRTLFWALFNLSPPPNNIETSIPNNKSTPIIMFIVEAMYASYYVTAVIVLLRMLVAMMTTSYRDIESRADVEWKYARSKLWMTYIEEGSTLPPPVNLLPSMKWATRLVIYCFTGRFWTCASYKDKDPKKIDEQRRKDEYNYRRLVEKLIGRYRKEKARVNLIYPEETEEIGKSIVVLHTENRRLVSLIQRLTKDSEEHAKNWYHDYNVRNQYLNKSQNSEPATDATGMHNSMRNQPHRHPPSGSAINFVSTYGGTSHESQRCMTSNSMASGNQSVSYSMTLPGVSISVNQPSVDDDTSHIHRYNGQGRHPRLFVDEAEEIIVDTDMSSCDSPVRQIFCQSGSSVDEADVEDNSRLLSPPLDRKRSSLHISKESDSDQPGVLVKDETRV